jgi:DNA polymerase-3 subunit gamma/tau
MSYQVIARKWRPQTFEEVTGQEHITRTLRGAIEHDRLHHAYLFSGARGVGKTTTARLLAKAVNCHKSDKPTPTPCAFTDPTACPSCREIAEGGSMDVLEIDAASNRGIDIVRETIIGTVSVRPARDRFRVFIIDEVHMLTPESFNALLKTLEEPPPRVLFIMATTEQHKLPATILSRCQIFEFRTIAAAKIAERLRLIAKAEKVKVSDNALREIARAGEGSMRDAQSAFDQVISFSEGQIEPRDVEAALGIAGREMLARVMRSVVTGSPAEALSVVDELVSRGHDLRNFCRDLLAHVRDLLITKVAGDSSALSDVGDAERRSMAEESKDFSESDLVRFFHSLTETEGRLRESAHPRYQLEVGLVKLVEMRRLAPLAQILERLGALEEAMRTGVAPTAAGSSSAPPASSTSGGGPARRGTGGGGLSSAASSSSVSPSQRAGEAPAPLDLSSAPTVGFNSSAASAHAPAPARLKLVQPVDGVEAPTPTRARTIDDDAPFPSDGAVQAGAAPARAPQPTAPESVARSSSFSGADDAWPQAEASEPASGDLLGRIKRALDARRKPFLVVAIEEARTARVGEGELFVAFTPDKKYLRDTLAKPDNVRLLQEVCREVAGRPLGVSIVVREANEEDDAPPTPEDEARRERERLRQWAESRPEVQKVMRDFRAEIIDVRRVDGEAPPQ